MGDTGGMIREVLDQFEELLGRRPESVSAMKKNDDGGWTLRLEVVELQRIPDSGSLLATYEVQVDGDGGLAGWERVRRYSRGRADSR
jgi:hypothetical protein